MDTYRIILFIDILPFKIYDVERLHDNQNGPIAKKQ